MLGFLVLAFLADNLECPSSVLFVAFWFLELRELVTQTDVVIRTTDHFEWFRLLEGGDKTWLRRKILTDWTLSSLL